MNYSKLVSAVYKVGKNSSKESRSSLVEKQVKDKFEKELGIGQLNFKNYRSPQRIQQMPSRIDEED
jgi:hypothetical protein